MIRRRLVTGVAVAALLIVANTTDASFCNVNCALATQNRSQDLYPHHHQLSAITTAQHHHHDDVTPGARGSRTLVSFRSTKCSVYSQFVALANASKVGLIKDAFSTNIVAVYEPGGPVSDFSGQYLSAPNWVHSPPETDDLSVVPLRI